MHFKCLKRTMQINVYYHNAIDIDLFWNVKPENYTLCIDEHHSLFHNFVTNMQYITEIWKIEKRR